MNKRQSSLNQITDPHLNAANAFYFYQLEELDKLRRIYPMMTDQQMDRIIVQSWFMLQESEQMKYELIRESCVMAQFQEQAMKCCNEFGVPFDNLKDICIKEKERFDQMYRPLQYSKQEDTYNNQVIKNTSMMVIKEQFQQPKDSGEVLERVLNLRMKSQSHKMKSENTQPLNFQINYCASSREIMQDANLMKAVIIESFPDANVEIYPAGGKSGDIIIYRIEQGQNTLIWSSLVDGFISQDDSQAFIKVLKYIQQEEN